jgi:hypothetical protein
MVRSSVECRDQTNEADTAFPAETRLGGDPQGDGFVSEILLRPVDTRRAGS